MNATNVKSDVIGARTTTIGLRLVPVKVQCSKSSRVVTTYAFLDAGSNTTFCTDELLEQLGVQGEKTALSLTTLQHEDSLTNCSLISLEVSDLDNNYMVELTTVFSTERLPLSKSSIPQQEDVHRWPYLKGVTLRRVDASIGLLIGNNVRKALELKEIKHCHGKGPYAVRTIFGWTINGRLGRNESAHHCVKFIRSDDVLNDQFRKFCNMEFNDSTCQGQLKMSAEDSSAL